MARVTINKPDKYNAMTLSTVDEMFRAFYDANHDTSIGVIVVAGAGKHFGVGGDVEWERGACARPSTTATPTTG